MCSGIQKSEYIQIPELLLMRKRSRESRTFLGAEGKGRISRLVQRREEEMVVETVRGLLFEQFVVSAARQH